MNIYQGDTYYKPGSHATGVQNWSQIILPQMPLRDVSFTLPFQ